MTKPRTHTHTQAVIQHTPPHLCAQTYSDVLRRTQTYSIYSCRVLEHPHLCAQTGASRAFRACVGQADAQGASCQAATRPLSLESLWSEQKELKVKGLESLWSEKKELKELKVKCGWPAAVKHARKAPQNPVPTALSTRFQHAFKELKVKCGWPAAGLRQSNICGWPAAGLRLACGWPAAVKHARKAPQNPVPTALSTHFVLYTHTHTHGATHASSIAETSSSIHAQASV